MDDILTRLVNWSDPWFWVCLASVLYSFAVIGFLPLTSEKELTTVEHVLMHSRRVLLLALLLLTLGFPSILWFLSLNLSGNVAAANNIVDIVITGQLWADVGPVDGGIACRTHNQNYFFALYIPPVFVLVHIQAGIAERRSGLGHTSGIEPLQGKRIFTPTGTTRQGRYLSDYRRTTPPCTSIWRSGRHGIKEW